MTYVIYVRDSTDEIINTMKTYPVKSFYSQKRIAEHDLSLGEVFACF